MTAAQAQCLCGDITLAATLPSLWAAHCHCSLCRRAHGAAFVTWVGMDAPLRDRRCEAATSQAPIHVRRRARLLRPLRHHDVLPQRTLARRIAHRPGPLHHAGGPDTAGPCLLGRPCAVGGCGSERRLVKEHTAKARVGWAPAHHCRRKPHIGLRRNNARNGSADCHRDRQHGNGGPGPTLRLSDTPHLAGRIQFHGHHFLATPAETADRQGTAADRIQRKRLFQWHFIDRAGDVSS